VAGTDRGGEDVSLHVELVSDERPYAAAVEEEVLAAYAAWRASAHVDEDGDGNPDVEDGVFVTDKGRLKTVSSEYGFQVDEDEEAVRHDLVALAQRGLTYDLAHQDRHFGVEPEWRHGLRSGLYRLEADLYEHGNAD
jgi:hypothetical protein